MDTLTEFKKLAKIRGDQDPTAIFDSTSLALVHTRVMTQYQHINRILEYAVSVLSETAHFNLSESDKHKNLDMKVLLFGQFLKEVCISLSNFWLPGDDAGNYKFFEAGLKKLFSFDSCVRNFKTAPKVEIEALRAVAIHRGMRGWKPRCPPKKSLDFLKEGSKNNQVALLFTCLIQEFKEEIKKAVGDFAKAQGFPKRSLNDALTSVDCPQWWISFVGAHAINNIVGDFTYRLLCIEEDDRAEEVHELFVDIVSSYLSGDEV